MEAPDPARGDPGSFVAEGMGAVRRLVGSGRRIRSVLVDAARRRALAGDLDGLAVPVYEASQEVMAGACGFRVHRGVLAVGERWPLPQPDALLAGSTRVVLLEGINDHENLGALFRSAAALGIDGVLLSPQCCDPLYRRSVRVSIGHVLTLPWTRLEPWPEGIGGLRRAGYTVAALTPAPDAQAIGPGAAGALALLVGAEGPGLSPAALASADTRWRIPMHGGADSLNVAAAAAVAFYATSPSSSS